MSVVCWRWGERYTAAHVNALARAIRRHYARSHRMICVTSDAAGIDPGIEVVPDTVDFAAVPSPNGAAAPSCYRRLRAFHLDAAQWFGERFVSLDLDVAIVGDLAPLWDRAEDFVGLQDPLYPAQLNGSMFLLTAGSRPWVWSGFDPVQSPAQARAAGFLGSDQAWLSWCLGGEPRWTAADGVLSYRKDCAHGLPRGARVVSFHGRTKPWSPEAPGWAREAAHQNPTWPIDHLASPAA